MNFTLAYQQKLEGLSHSRVSGNGKYSASSFKACRKKQCAASNKRGYNCRGVAGYCGRVDAMVL